MRGWMAVACATLAVLAGSYVGGVLGEGGASSAARLPGARGGTSVGVRPNPEEEEKAVHSVACAVTMASILPGPGFGGVPGDAGFPRFGIPEGETPMRVRRSWSSLSEEEQREVIDAFVLLKLTTADDVGERGAERANYESFCEGSYPRNLYDFYVEAHLSAFYSVHTPDMKMIEHPHMGPQFLPWHRYLLLRLEADLREVSGNPDLALPYWDWADCRTTDTEGVNECLEIFRESSLGSPGSCDSKDTVTGYLVDQGFSVNVYASSNRGESAYSSTTLVCTEKALERNVGCTFMNGGQPPSAADEAAIFARPLYDVPPYDSCGSDENVSLRQYVEGYTTSDINPACVLGGCQMHGLGHFFVGGDMAATSAPNDPIFFMHHANVDRMWANWQDRNLTAPKTSADYGNPGYPAAWRGALFNFHQVRADEMFDFRSLGYRYDSNRGGDLPAPPPPPCAEGSKLCPEGQCVPADVDCCGASSCAPGLLCASADAGRCCPIGKPVACPDPRFCVPVGAQDLCDSLAEVPPHLEP